MKNLLIYLKQYTKESILAPFFKLLEVIFDLLVPLVVAGMINHKDAEGSSEYIFPYSIRTSTAAAGFKNQVPEHIKALRAKKMAEICDRVTAEVLEEFKGLTFNVLTETKEGEYFVGHSENYTKVYIKAGEDFLKKIHPVRIIIAVSL